MVHHRIPKKKRNKLKSVDPFNKNRSKLPDEKEKNRNLEPVNDDQPLTRRQKELFKNIDRTFPKKTRIRNHVLNEFIKGGFEVRDLHSTASILKQVNIQTNEEVKEKFLLAKFGVAGRDSREINADIAELDAKKDRQKEHNAARLKNILKEKRRQISNISRKKLVVEEENKKTSSTGKKEVDSHETAVKKQLSRKEINKRRRREERYAEEKEIALNARELIPFGSRVDGPPNLSSLGLLTPEQSLIRPGIKPLLLKNADELTALPEKTTAVHGKKIKVLGLKRRKDLAAEREKVIEAYRSFKKSKLEMSARL